MLILPRPRFAAAPLLSLTVAVCGGIIFQHYAKLNSRSFPIVLAIALTASVICLVSLKRGKLVASTLSLFIAFFCTGTVLVQTIDRPLRNRISTMYDQGAIGPDDPVEIVGVVSGEPEPAPQSFYLTMRVERVATKGSGRDASGTVSLLAQASTEKLKQEYDALTLHHGARLRVMTKLDRKILSQSRRLAIHQYLKRKGYEATGTIKSPLLVERLDDERVFLPLAWVYSWRARLAKGIFPRFSAETAGVLMRTAGQPSQHFSPGGGTLSRGWHLSHFGNQRTTNRVHRRGCTPARATNNSTEATSISDGGIISLGIRDRGRR